jgi:hypothetical protein
MRLSVNSRLDKVFSRPGLSGGKAVQNIFRAPRGIFLSPFIVTLSLPPPPAGGAPRQKPLAASGHPCYSVSMTTENRPETASREKYWIKRVSQNQSSLIFRFVSDSNTRFTYENGLFLNDCFMRFLQNESLLASNNPAYVWYEAQKTNRLNLNIVR